MFTNKATCFRRLSSNRIARIFLLPWVWLTLQAAPLTADDVLQVSLTADGIAASATLGAGAGRRISADGRYVVFETTEGSLLPGVTDLNTVRDVVLLDLQTGVTILVSHTAASMTTAANGMSYQPVISADGLWVAFLSGATDLIPMMVEDNTPTQDDVFLWSRATGALRLVSHAVGLPSQTGDGGSFAPTISDDGSAVAFGSQSENLVTQTDINGGDRDVFLFDRLAMGSNVLLVSGATQTGNSSSSQPVLSGDGAWVTFTSRATDLIAGVDTNGTDDVFLWERATSGTPASLTLLSHVLGDPTTAGNDRSRSTSISADGGVVAFESEADDLVAVADSNDTGDVFVWQRTSGLLTLASHLIGDSGTAGNDTSGPPRISADGSQVIFVTDADDLVGASGTDNNGDEDIFVYSVASGAVTLVSHAAGQPLVTSNRSSRQATISDDGASIVFNSFATDLLASADNNGTSDVFRWQQATNTVTLLSHAGGQPLVPSNGPSSKPEISGDGSTTVFESLGYDLVAGAFGGLFVDAGASELAVAGRRAPLRNVGAQSLAFDSAVDFGRRQISENGRYVVFTSEGTHIAAGQQDVNFGAADVFLLDVESGSTTLVSHIPGQPLVTASSTSELPEMSADGAWIIFRSRAVDLVTPSLPNLFRNHIYLYEVATGAIRLVTHAPGLPSVAGNRTSDEARLSADGTRIAIASEASNLTAGSDLNSFLNDVFLYEIATDTMTRVSNSATGASTHPVLDDAGNAVAFESLANDLVAGADTNGASDIFLFDRISGTTSLVSHTFAGVGIAGNQAATQATISGDGGRVAFRSRASDMLAGVDANGTQADVFLFERLTGAVGLVSHTPGSPTTNGDRASNNPVISRDGSVVVLDSTATDLTAPAAVDFFADVFRYDIAADTLQRVSQTPTGGTPSSHSTLASVSSDGDEIAYSSTAQDITLLADGNGALPDLFFFDVSSSTTTLVSRRFDGTASANATTERAIVAGNGAAVLFRSVAGDMMAMVDNVSGPGDVYLFETAQTAVDLSLALVATSGQVLPGGLATLELTVDKTSAPAAARTVAVLDLPAGASFQGAMGSGWGCVGLGSTAVCELDVPLTGTAPILGVDVQMPLVAGPWTVRAAVKSLPQESNPVDNVAQLILTSPPIDFGDAPSGFPTLLVDNGASHGIINGLNLGSSVDDEVDGQPSVMADGDDTDGGDDEDGVSFPMPILSGLGSSVDVVASAAGRLDAWFDWNGDGDWDDPSEKVFDALTVSAGMSSLPLAVPLSATVGVSFARFRLSSGGAPLPSGPAADGEVEDHVLTIAAPSSLAVDDVTLAEGDAGGTTFTFTVSLMPLSSSTITVDFATVDGTATTADGDYQAISGTLTFAPGVLQQTVNVVVEGDLAEESDEVFELVLSNPSLAVVADAIGQGTIVDDDDQGAPIVTGVQTVGDGASVLACGDVRRTFQRLRLTFDQLMSDPPGDNAADDVTNPTNYLLVAAGLDAELSTTDCGAVLGDDQAVTIKSVSWMPDTSSANLVLAGSRVNGLYRLLACSDLRDLAGNLLDGDGDGTGGDAFVRRFRLSNSNLFVNGHFDDCTPIELDPWEVIVSGSNIVSTHPDDVDGSSLSGSALFEVSEPGNPLLRQCVPATAGHTYRLAANLRFQPMVAATATAVLACEYFDGVSCDGSVLDELISTRFLTPANQVWQGFEFLPVAPPQSASARCRVEVMPTNGMDPNFELGVDGLFVGEGPLFADGFESEDTSAWSATVP